MGNQEATPQTFAQKALARAAGLDSVQVGQVVPVVQIVQIVLLAVAPPIAGMVALAALFWAVWVFASFVAELHGFLNPMKVLGGVILTAIVLFFVVSILLAMSGLMPQGAV